MALVKYGGGIIQMSGSIAGNTHARNRFGNYIRARTKPVNPNSARQQTVRAALATLTYNWGQILTAVQRTAWNLYAASVSMKNRLGENVNLTGFNHYIRSNLILLQDAKATIADGPTTFEIPEQDPVFAITASEATNDITVTYDDTLEWCDEDNAYMYVFGGTPQNPQRNFFAGPWRLGDSIDGDSGSPPSSTGTVASPFILTETQRVWAYARILRADGRMSEPFQADCFCAA